MPGMINKISSMSFRVPTQIVSSAYIYLTFKKKNKFKEASFLKLKTLLIIRDIKLLQQTKTSVFQKTLLQMNIQQ